MMLNKIIIGTANLNTKYGLIKNNLNEKEFKKILIYAKKNKINTIDTSPNYTNSEKIIGKINHGFNVITKIPKIPLNLKTNELSAWIEKKIFDSLNNTNVKKFYGIHIQNAEVLLSNRSKTIYSTLSRLKKMKKYNKIGISIYNFNTLMKVIKKFKIDFIQVPFNVFDTRLLDKKLLNLLKKKKIEVHARSIFLQGLLVKNNYKIPAHLKDLKNNVKIWKNWVKEQNISQLNACLQFAFCTKEINKFVIGFNKFDEFKEIINFKKKNLNFKEIRFKTKKNVIDPRTWNKL